MNIYHYDYNTLFLDKYCKYINRNKENPILYIPFLSISSTSPVSVGFVALLKSINNNLTPIDYKNILIETSKEMIYKSEECPRVIDIYGAVKLISKI